MKERRILESNSNRKFDIKKRSRFENSISWGKKISFLLFSIIFSTTIFAQKGLNEKANELENTKCLDNFFEKLQQSNDQKIHILHIGDSHIQADYFSGKMREYFQEKYGNAGFGFCFPYKLARTNGKKVVKYTSNTHWKAKRNSLRRPIQATGISGHSIETSTPYFELKIASMQDSPWNYNQLFLFKNPNQFSPVVGIASSKLLPYETKKVQSKQKVYHKVKSGNTLYGIALKYHVRVKNLKSWNNIRGNMIRIGQKLIVKNGQYPDQLKRIKSSALRCISPFEEKKNAGYFAYQFQENNPTIYIHGDEKAQKNKWTFTGFYLDDQSANGIVYSAIGANGAQFKDYLSSDYFFKQIACVKSDLLIISLGTNESLNYPFKANELELQIDEFLLKIKKATSCSAILLTTPPDVMKGRGSRRRYNPNVNVICELLQKAAVKHQIAIWDFNKVMGGYKSVSNWHATGLGQKDRVHFSKAGYEKQAVLFWKAIQKSVSTAQ